MKDYMAEAMAALEQAQAIAKERGDESEAYGLNSAMTLLRAYGGARVRQGAPIQLNGNSD